MIINVKLKIFRKGLIKMKVLFICKKRYVYGSREVVESFGLVNSADLVCKGLSKHNIECKVVVVIDANSIDNFYNNYKPDIVIIEAMWVAPDKLKQIMKLHPKKLFIVRIHSKIPFLSYEGIAIKWLKEYAELEKDKWNIKIGSNNKSTTKELSKLLDVKLLYLPNVYPVTKIKKYEKSRRNVINIGCFGSIRPLKNTLIQAIAAIDFANDKNMILHFHINNKTEQMGERILKNLESLFEGSIHRLIKHEWYDYKDFIEVVRKMDYGMQVSYSESFNIVIADFINNNIPIVVSDEIDYLPEYNYANPNSVEDMVYVLKLFSLFRFFIVNVNKNALQEFTEKSIKIWLKILL